MKDFVLDAVVVHYVIGGILFVIMLLATVAVWFHEALSDWWRSRQAMQRMQRQVFGEKAPSAPSAPSCRYCEDKVPGGCPVCAPRKRQGG